MSSLFRSIAAGMVLLATVIVPPFLYTAFGTSSMAAGVLLVSGLYSLLFLMLDRFHRLGQKRTTLFLIIIGIITLIGVQAGLNSFVSDEFDFSRFWQSLALLIICIFGALFMARLTQRVSASQADLAVKIVFIGLCLSGLAGILGYSPFSSPNFSKPVLFFGEPSHFALGFLPFLLYITVVSTWRLRLLYVSASLLMAFLLQNLTLVIGVGLVIVVTFSFRRILTLIPLFVIALFTLNIGYYTERLDISKENQNLSMLVYLQGWEQAQLNLVDSDGRGVGFQQFGIIGDRGEITDEIVKLAGGDLNIFDGGSVAPKIVGEFGIVGVMALLIYLFYFVTKVKWLHHVSMIGITSNEYKHIFFTSSFLMFSVDLFIRGTGYFSPSSFLFMTSLMWMNFYKPRDAHATSANRRGV